MIRCVVDTNILVSSLLYPSGNEGQIVLAIRQKILRPCLSDDIVEEYVRVLARRKFCFPRHISRELVAAMRRNGELFHSGASVVVSPDPADSMFLDCAIAAGADFIVTGNLRHFPSSIYGSAHVVNAGELLAWIAAGL